MGLETFEAIAQQLDETRMLMFGQSFDLPADKVILDYLLDVNYFKTKRGLPC